MVNRDGHIHSPYCPHGTKDKLKDYVIRAIQLGYQEITFTEHAPLPSGFVDPTPLLDSAISLEQLDFYLEDVEKLKADFQGSIKINTGLEVDFIEGFEEETTRFLNEVGPRIDDAILSVHFLKNGSNYDCLDYSPDVFSKIIADYGSIEKVYQKYFETVEQSILADLGPFKPKRIGHMTLVRKFRKRFPVEKSFDKEIFHLLRTIKEFRYELDYNGAGMAKPLCQETYPPLWVAKEAMKLQIPLIYGSDAHQVKELDQGKEHCFLME
jgi:histidinol-phosphatase (PHP family)